MLQGTHWAKRLVHSAAVLSCFGLSTRYSCAIDPTRGSSASRGQKRTTCEVASPHPASLTIDLNQKARAGSLFGSQRCSPLRIGGSGGGCELLE